MTSAIFLIGVLSTVASLLLLAGIITTGEILGTSPFHIATYIVGFIGFYIFIRPESVDAEYREPRKIKEGRKEE